MQASTHFFYIIHSLTNVIFLFSVDSEGLLSGLVHSGDRFLEVDAENVSQMDCTGLSNLIKMKGKQKTNADEIEIVVFSYQSAPPVHMLES